MEVSLPLLLGENPSKTGDRYHQFPLSGAVGERLCTLAGIDPDPDGTRYGRYYWALRERFDCQNLFERYADGVPWSAPRARERWEAVLGEDYPECERLVVTVLGRRVGEAVGLPANFPWCEWGRLRGALVGGGDVLVGLIPHPSGLNRLYNAQEMRALVSRTLREAIVFANRQPRNEQWCVGCSPQPDGEEDGTSLCSGCGPIHAFEVS